MPDNIAGTTGFTGGAYQKPSTKDSGSDVFTTLESFMTRIAAHTHDGVDSELINRTVTKSAYTNTGTLSFAVESVTGQSYTNITIGSSHTINKGGAATVANNNKYSFYYYADEVVDGGGGGPGWVRFHPEYVWDSYSVITVYTNIPATILAAAAVPIIKVEAY